MRPVDRALADLGPLPPDLPRVASVVVLEPEPFAAIQRAIRLLFALTRTEAYAARVDADASITARHRPGNAGVFMGYDFHLTPEGPRLIEVNTNAGGALLNGLHTASLCRPEVLACLCQGLLPVETIEARVVETFRSELALARGRDARLERVAILDDRPREQPLYAEFEGVRALLARSGIEARIGDTAELQRRPGGGVALAGWPVDLVYLRDTDFQMEAPRSRVLGEAYRAGEVVVTPSPREHHLLAHKERLAIFCDAPALRALGLSGADAAFLATTVPETRPLVALGIERVWRERRSWVLKPGAGYASRGVYRGDKISRRKLDEIAAAGGYLAQRRVEPAHIEVATTEGPRRLKFDVRAYAYRDEILLLGARAYAGQVTNLRAPGGFSAICVARAEGMPPPSGSDG